MNTAVYSHTENKLSELNHRDHLLFGVLSQESSLHFIKKKRKEKNNNKTFIFQPCSFTITMTVYQKNCRVFKVI